jgi:hypothetical protein
MPWYKVTLPSSECGTSGKGEALRSAFESAFMANRSPKDAALFTNDSEDLKHCFYYFSPGAAAIAKALIETYKAVKCSAPVQGEVALLLGHADAPKTLLAKKGND